ncbi:Fanconi-associated nuclease [Favolaschia claudopus]|uniref:Fanconi-associated nuclease n=1 Tax=Favolaschia claudopus TaxID=2862362 RepID=A0AAW0E073_9AGAR
MNGYTPWDIRDTIFGIEEHEADSEYVEPERAILLEQLENASATGATGPLRECDQPSIYVLVAERAINNVYEHERHLFLEEEWDFVKAIMTAYYCSRFVIIRLLLRKQGKWFRHHDLRKYISEVGPQGLDHAMEELCRSHKPSPNSPEIIDLTLDSDDEEDSQPKAGPSSAPQRPIVTDNHELCLDYFCQGVDKLSLFDGLNLLKVDEIKSLCKDLKIPAAKMNKEDMITALMNHASKQSTLAVVPSPKSKGKGKAKASDSGLRQTVLSFATPKIRQNQTERLQTMMLKALDKAVKVNPDLHTLILRLHIIWLRSTEYPESLFRPALFAGFKKTVFPEYDFARDPDIWRTRDEFLAYEKALRLDATIDELLQPDPKPKSGRPAKASVPDICQKFIPPGTPGFNFMHAMATPLRTPGPQADDHNSAEDEEEAPAADLADAPPTQANALAVKRIYEEHVLPTWKQLAATESASPRVRKPGLERFEAGFLYTRMMRKCGQALGTLKEWRAEKELLDLLLGQRFWRRSRRGGWQDRRALLLTKHLNKNEDGTQNLEVWWQARRGLIESLGDKDTAMVDIHPLVARLNAVEKKLKIPEEEKFRHDYVALKEATVVTFAAIRVWEKPGDVKSDGSEGKENKVAEGGDITTYFPPDSPAKIIEPQESVTKRSWTGKSYWKGKDGLPIYVEDRALEYYDEVHGMKGFHSETQILTTLFGLLFWEIIFAPVPGAFETPFQMGPLDVGEDSFYYARQRQIDERLAAIRSGQSSAILADNDARHREKKTGCIGVSWDVCTREHLLEIVECLGGHTLASICQIFCQDYYGRSSGGPDLIVWNPETKQCKFVEVKGPGDSLKANQKLWSHALLTARCEVELCQVEDVNRPKKAKATPKPKSEKKPKASTARGSKRKGKGKASAQPDSDIEVEGSQLAPMNVDAGDEEWTPSAEIRKPPPRTKRRRSTREDDDELPVFTIDSQPEQSEPISPPPKRIKTS